MTSRQQEGRTWIPSPTICTSIIARDGLDQFLKGLLITRLVTLAQCGGHVVIIYSEDSEYRVGYGSSQLGDAQRRRYSNPRDPRETQ